MKLRKQRRSTSRPSCIFSLSFCFRSVLSLVAVALLFGASVCFSSIGGGAPSPVRKLSDLPQPAISEAVFRVSTARVVWADYDLIRLDFESLKSKSNQEIDQWLLRFALVSKNQFEQNYFNSQIQGQPENELQVVRPKNYGRGLVVETGDGLIDLKGAGSNQPRQEWEDGDPRDGTYTLAAAIRENIFYKIVRHIFEIAPVVIRGRNVQPVGNYAILDGGFDVIHRNEAGQEVGRSPWGFLFRRAHSRFENPQARVTADKGKYYLLNQQASLTIEKVLRSFGITSVGAGRRQGDLEGGINIQGSPYHEIFDFGNYLAYESFPEVDVTHFYGQKPLLRPGKGFIQPDPMRRVPIETWGPHVSGVFNSIQDKPYVYSAETAHYISRTLREGKLEEGKRAYLNHESNMTSKFLRVGRISCQDLLEKTQ